MPFVTIGEKHNVPMKMYYELHGEGKNKVLLIMGLMTPHNAWEPQIRFFASKPEYQLAVFDNRGCGDSTVTYFGYSSSQQAQDAIELCDFLQWEKFHVVAISMGGMIAIELALHNLDRILSLSLAVTHCGGYSSMAPLVGVWKIFQSAFQLSVRDQARIAQTMLFSKEFLDRTDGEGDRARPMIETLVEEFMTHRNNKRPSIIGALGQFKTVLTHNVSYERLKPLKNSNIPILIMTGTKDDLVNPVNSHNLHKFLERSNLAIFEGAGHCINRECPEKFNAEILKNIEKGIP